MVVWRGVFNDKRQKVQSSLVNWVRPLQSLAELNLVVSLLNALNWVVKLFGELPNTPLLLDQQVKAEDKPLLEFMSKAITVGRPVSTTPGVPADRVAALRKAFMETMKDKDFLADVAKGNMEVNPIPPERLEKLVANAYSLPASLIARVNALQKPPSTMAKVAYPSMRQFGYSDALATGAIASGGTLGILIPPSVIMVIYALMTEVRDLKNTVAALRHAQALVVEEGARALLGGKHLVAHRIVGDAGDDFALALEGDGDGEDGMGAHEIGGAVDRIDDPAVVPVGGWDLAGLFQQEAEFRARLEEFLAQHAHLLAEARRLVAGDVGGLLRAEQPLDLDLGQARDLGESVPGDRCVRALPVLDAPPMDAELVGEAVLAVAGLLAGLRDPPRDRGGFEVHGSSVHSTADLHGPRAARVRLAPSGAQRAVPRVEAGTQTSHEHLRQSVCVSRSCAEKTTRR